MPLSRKPNSHKASRKWKRCGKVIKHILLSEGGSNKRPTRKLKEYIEELLEEEEEEE
jgi:hypothetical protein